jgi:hypothetical protein
MEAKQPTLRNLTAMEEQLQLALYLQNLCVI